MWNFAPTFFYCVSSGRNVLSVVMSNRRQCLLKDSLDARDSTETSIFVDQLNTVKDGKMSVVDYKNSIILQCLACNTVLGDSFGICGEVPSLDAIVAWKVTGQVKINEKLDTSLNGQLASCTFQSVSCAGCLEDVGFVVRSSPVHLSALRNLFLLQKEQISCYMLRNGKTVKACEVSFKSKHYGPKLKELKENLQAQMKQLIILEERMEKLLIK